MLDATQRCMRPAFSSTGMTGVRCFLVGHLPGDEIPVCHGSSGTTVTHREDHRSILVLQVARQCNLQQSILSMNVAGPRTSKESVRHSSKAGSILSILSTNVESEWAPFILSTNFASRCNMLLPTDNGTLHTFANPNSEYQTRDLAQRSTDLDTNSEYKPHESPDILFPYRNRNTESFKLPQASILSMKPVKCETVSNQRVTTRDSILSMNRVHGMHAMASRIPGPSGTA